MSPHNGPNTNSTLSGLNASASSSAGLLQQRQQQQQHDDDDDVADELERSAIDIDPPVSHASRHHMKRSHANNGSNAAAAAAAGTSESKYADFLCPICFDLIIEAHITRCGHTFCFRCITKSVEVFKRCPKCSYNLTTCENIFPNYLLDELITKYKIKKQIHDKFVGVRAGRATTEDFVGPAGDGLKNFLTTESQKLTLPDVNVIMDILQQRKQLLEAETSTAQNRLLYDFLKHLLRLKEKAQAQTRAEIEIIKQDLEDVEGILKNISLAAAATTTTATATSTATAATAATTPATANQPSTSADTPAPMSVCDDVDGVDERVEQLSRTASRDSAARTESIDTLLGGLDDALNAPKPQPLSHTYVSRKRRMYAHFDDFVASYFSIRSQELLFGKDADDAPAKPANDTDSTTKSRANAAGLDRFRENLVQFSKYNTLRPLATMHYSSDLHNNSTIVSTIVFDKDNEYFAIGGVTRRIKVFDYLAVVRDTVDIHYPNVEMISQSKISCIAWNSYHKNVMASSDYEGAVNLWDVQSGTRTKCFHEHEKRCWSVDFNNVDSRLIASGSDDSRVKLWSTNDDHSIATLEAKANVCCVKFNPKSSCHLAFGSADHDVHYYDLRNLTKPLCVFKGHKKAVSYVKFLNTNEIISASTDSQLKLWNVNSPPYSLRSFVGHVNEKNFVGLATDGDYIACGSEDNALYIYYKGLSKQLFSFRIDSCPAGGRSSGANAAGGAVGGTGSGGNNAVGTITDSDRYTDTNDFVSAVCWRKQCNVVLAANSRGLIKILELV